MENKPGVILVEMRVRISAQPGVLELRFQIPSPTKKNVRVDAKNEELFKFFEKSFQDQNQVRQMVLENFSKFYAKHLLWSEADSEFTFEDLGNEYFTFRVSDCQFR